MARFVEVAGYWCIFVIGDAVSVSVHPLTECLLRLTNVLQSTSVTGDEIDDARGITRQRMAYRKGRSSGG